MNGRSRNLTRRLLYRRRFTSQHTGGLLQISSKCHLRRLQGRLPGALRIPLAKTFQLEEVAEAHRYMEENKALGKIVVLT